MSHTRMTTGRFLKPLKTPVSVRWCFLTLISGSLVPAISIVEQMWLPARAGAREIFVDRPDLILPGYTGLSNMANQKMGFPLVIEVDGRTGRCQLPYRAIFQQVN